MHAGSPHRHARVGPRLPVATREKESLQILSMKRYSDLIHDSTPLKDVRRGRLLGAEGARGQFIHSMKHRPYEGVHRMSPPPEQAARSAWEAVELPHSPGLRLDLRCGSPIKRRRESACSPERQTRSTGLFRGRKRPRWRGRRQKQGLEPLRAPASGSRHRRGGASGARG